MLKLPRLFGKRYNHKLTMRRVNYDQIADKYNRRYRVNSLTVVESALVKVARKNNVKMILEVGCGTGRLLNGLANSTSNAQFYGLDYSLGMLVQAQDQPTPLHLMRGKGSQLPFEAHTFDLLFCLNALHHFDDPQNFINKAQQVLRPGGKLAIIGQVPQDRRNRWFVYDYFDGIFKTDLERFPTWGNEMDWMVNAGFQKNSWEPIEWIVYGKQSWEILDDPFLKKHAVSQLAMLIDEDYVAGIQQIKQAIRRAEAAAQILEFKTQSRLDMITAYKNARSYKTLLVPNHTNFRRLNV